jgi:hypothetical protein
MKNSVETQKNVEVLKDVVSMKKQSPVTYLY